MSSGLSHLYFQCSIFPDPSTSFDFVFGTQTQPNVHILTLSDIKWLVFLRMPFSNAFRRGRCGHKFICCIFGLFNPLVIKRWKYLERMMYIIGMKCNHDQVNAKCLSCISYIQSRQLIHDWRVSKYFNCMLICFALVLYFPITLIVCFFFIGPLITTLQQ